MRHLKDVGGHVKGVAFAARRKFQRRTISTPIVEQGCDLVTVVHWQDLGLLRLQARSLATHLDPEFRGDIVVVLNDLDLTQTTRRFAELVLPDYGRWRERVRLVPFPELGTGLDPANGWIFQQALKLAAANRLSRPNYVLLDAKNHAIKPITAAAFVTADGRAIQQMTNCIPCMPAHQATCARYFSLDPDESPECSTMTPFVMRTQLVRDLIAKIEVDEGCAFFAFFTRTRLLSEFKLYRLYLHAIHRHELDCLYADGPILGKTVWTRDGGLNDTLADAETSADALFLGIHRQALAQLDPAERCELEGFWRRHGLLRAGETIVSVVDEVSTRPPLRSRIGAKAALRGR